MEADPAASPERWRQLGWLSATVLLAMFLWFSATAVGPQLRRDWRLNAAQQAWLTISVQLGFVAGALSSALLNLPDRVPAQRLMAVSAAAGALANLGIAFAPSPTAPGGSFVLVIALRGLTGTALAGVYPPGMKLVASWFRKERGLAIGALVGALTLGSASPHALNLLPLERWHPGGFESWRLLLVVVSGCALAAAVLAAVALRPGPLLATRAARFRWSYVVTLWRDEPLRRANFGYLGHQWELYAMWAWTPVFLLESFRERPAGRVAGFLAVAVGAVGCVVAGRVADRWGRCWTTSASLLASGTCALFAGFLGDWPWLAAGVCVVWGLAVVADSAQFSAAISELSDPELVGTALTVQTCAGFLLTTLSIRLLPILREHWGWGPTFASLAIGPLFGIWNMWRLRRHPSASQMAGGKG